MRRPDPVYLGPWVLAAIGMVLGCTPDVRESDPLDLELQTERVAPQSRALEIRRAALEDVLSKGPGRFFERVEVVPAFIGNRKFVGYTLRNFYGGMTPQEDGVQVGDVVTAVNGKPISRPDEFMAVWASAGRRETLDIDVTRGAERMQFTYRIVGDLPPNVPEPSENPASPDAPAPQEE